MSRPSREFMIDKLVQDMESWPEEEIRKYALEERMNELKEYTSDEELMQMCEDFLPEGWSSEFFK